VENYSFYYVVPEQVEGYVRGKLRQWGVPHHVVRGVDGNMRFRFPDLPVRKYSQVRSLFGRDFDGTITGI